MYGILEYLVAMYTQRIVSVFCKLLGIGTQAR